MQKSKHFKSYEIVDRETYRIYGEFSYRFFDPILLRVADWLRDELGPVTCNNWFWNKDKPAWDVFEWSGLRTARWDEVQPSRQLNSKKKYTPYSDHALGNALDLKFRDHSAEYVRQYIRDNWERIASDTGAVSLTLEDGPTISWVHLATRNNNEGVNTFYM